jgi:hypothetical protein
MAENVWPSLGENVWPSLGENPWPIIARKMTVGAVDGEQVVGVAEVLG